MGKSIARIINGQIVYIDQHSPVVQPNDMAARANREDQKVRFRADLLQKSDPDYWKVYKDQAAELSPGLRRLLS